MKTNQHDKGHDGDETDQQHNKKIIGYPTQCTGDDQVVSDPYTQRSFENKRKAHMKQWEKNAGRLWRRDWKEALDELNQQIHQLDEMADWGITKEGVSRSLLPFECMHEFPDIAFLFKSPTVKEQECGSLSTLNPKTNYHGNLVNEMSQAIHSMGNDLSSSSKKHTRPISTCCFFAVPMTRWDDEKGDMKDIRRSAVELFAPYLVMALCIVKPRIIVCVGRICAEAIHTSLLSGLPRRGSAPYQKVLNEVNERLPKIFKHKVVSSDSTLLRSLDYIICPHPFCCSQSFLDSASSSPSADPIADSFKKKKTKDFMVTSSERLQVVYREVAARIFRIKSERNPIAVMMNASRACNVEKRGKKAFDKPDGVQLKKRKTLTQEDNNKETEEAKRPFQSLP